MNASVTFEVEAVQDGIAMLRVMARRVSMRPSPERMRWQERLIAAMARPDVELLVVRPADDTTLVICLGDALAKIISDGRGLGLHLED